MKLIVYGNPSDGFTFIGPVDPNAPEVESYIESRLGNVDWWYCPVTSLSQVWHDER